MTEHTSLHGKRIWVCGHRGMVGSAVVRRLAANGHDTLHVDRADLDLRRQADVEAWIRANRPDVIVVAAAIVGGLQANNAFPIAFLADNLSIATNVVRSAAEAEVPRLLFLASSCVYPRLAQQPIIEDALLTGELEPTNQWYAVAKIAGLKLAEAYHREAGLDYVSAIPVNLYGPHDDFDPATSHVIPSLIRRMHEAKLAGEDTIEIWGTGTPRRDFMHVDDCADALVHVLEHYHEPEPINIGTGDDISIAELARTVAGVVGFDGELRFDASKPDGMPRKGLHATKLKTLGWTGGRPLTVGLSETFDWFFNNAF
jgi:GDP-L-fucose synthase